MANADDRIEGIIVAELTAGRRLDFVLGEVYACQQGKLPAGWESLSRLVGIADKAQFKQGYDFRNNINIELERIKQLENQR